MRGPGQSTTEDYSHHHTANPSLQRVSPSPSPWFGFIKYMIAVFCLCHELYNRSVRRNPPKFLTIKVVVKLKHQINPKSEARLVGFRQYGENRS